MEQILELMKSMQEETRTHGAKVDVATKAIRTGTKAIRDKLDAHQEERPVRNQLKRKQN